MHPGSGIHDLVVHGVKASESNPLELKKLLEARQCFGGTAVVVHKDELSHDNLHDDHLSSFVPATLA
jgi:hypothetical protein